MSVILVTGASTGLGLASARALTDQGHEVVLHARHPARVKGLELVSRVRHVLYGDLADLGATLALAERARALGDFDAVIHNAGVLRGPDVVAVNVLAPYVLTLMLSPHRSIYLSSSMHFSGSPHLRTLTEGGRSRAYDDSKLYVTTLAMAIASRAPNISSHAVDPGWVPTRMGGAGAPDSLEAGQETQDWLATAPLDSISPQTGGYWYHRKVRNPHPAARDFSFQADLLDVLADRTGLVFPS